MAKASRLRWMARGVVAIIPAWMVSGAISHALSVAAYGPAQVAVDEARQSAFNARLPALDQATTAVIKAAIFFIDPINLGLLALFTVIVAGVDRQLLSVKDSAPEDTSGPLP